jgi:transposase
MDNGGTMKKRKLYTKEFKEGAVRLVTEQGRTRSDVAKSLGIGQVTLSRWINAAKEEGKDAFRGHGNRTQSEQEIFELKRRIKELEQEREILKKAAAYFAKHLE